MTTWLDFWNCGGGLLYVDERHRRVHHRMIAEDIARFVPHPGAVVLDYGPGEALEAARVAALCRRLILCEAAAEVRAGLAERHRGDPRIEVLGPDDLPRLPGASVDLVVVNSVVQYLSAGELEALLATARRLLAPGGRLVVADVIPPDAGAVADAVALLGLAARERFLLPAVIGLVQTALSPYRELRRSLGLARYAEAELLARLRDAGFAAERLPRNFGHNQRRMAFSARPLSSG